MLEGPALPQRLPRVSQAGKFLLATCVAPRAPVVPTLGVPALTGELVPAYGEGEGGPAPLTGLLLGTHQGGGTGTGAGEGDPCEVFPLEAPVVPHRRNLHQ